MPSSTDLRALAETIAADARLSRVAGLEPDYEHEIRSHLLGAINRLEASHGLRAAKIGADVWLALGPESGAAVH